MPAKNCYSCRPTILNILKRNLASVALATFCLLGCAMLKLNNRCENGLITDTELIVRTRDNNSGESDVYHYKRKETKSAVIRYDSLPLANKTWIHARKELLIRSRPEMTKILLFARMRGGSSILSDIFNQDVNGSVSWFEPLDSFYSAYYGIPYYSIPLTLHYDDDMTPRITSEMEKETLSQFLDNILSLKFDQLPVETLAHTRFINRSNAFKQFDTCLPSRGKKAKGKVMEVCSMILRHICGTTDIVRRNITAAVENNCHQIIDALRIIKPSAITASHIIRLNATEEKIYHLEFNRIRNEIKSIVGKDGDHHLKTFLNHHHCVGELEMQVRKCWSTRGDRFNQTTLVAAKLIRWSLPDIESLVQRRPDLHIIHFVRDPRATAASRTVGGTELYRIASDKRASVEAKALCARIRMDLIDKLSFESKYPGLILTLRYEDLIQKPHSTIKKVFKFVGMEPSAKMDDWVRQSLFSNKNSDSWGTMRVNGTEMIDKWKRMTTYSEAMLMNKYCSDVCDILGYSNLEH